MTTETNAPAAISPARAACEAFWATVGAGPSIQEPGEAWNWAISQCATGAWEAAAKAAVGAAGRERDETTPSWVLDALDDSKRRKLIESWQSVPGRGIVVIGADMEETELRSEHDAKLFLAGISSALTAFHAGEAAP